MFKILFSVFFFITTLGICQNISLETDEKTKNSKTETIKVKSFTNVLNLNNFNDFTSLSILDSAISQNQVFFIGEDHRYRKSNSELLLKLFVYLNKKNNLKDILIEQGTSSAFLINKYIIDGDEDAKKTLENYVLPIYFDLFSSLKSFNDTVKFDSLKVRVHGIDVERSLQNGFKVLGKLLPKNPAPSQIAVSIESISGMAGYYDHFFANMKTDTVVNLDARKLFTENQFNGNKTIKHIILNYKNNQAIYKEYLGDNFSLFKEVLEGLDKGQEWYSFQEESAYQEWIMREIYMAERFQDLISKYPNANFLGSFGRCHTSINITEAWCDLHQFKSLANRIREIKKQDNTKIKVLSIGTYYPLSGYFVRKKSDGFMIGELAKQVGDNEVRIFKVNNDTSFNQVKEAFQFIVINKRKLNEEKKAKFDIVFEDEESDDLLTHIDFNYTYFNYKNNDFNNLIASLGFDLPQNNIDLRGFGIVFHDKELLIGARYNQSQWYVYDVENQNHNLKFRANQLNLDILGNLTNSDVFLFAPGVSFGFGNFVFKEEINNSNSIFSNSIQNKINTPLLALSPMIQSRLNIKFFSFGLHGGYQWDYSRGYLTDSGNERVLNNQRFNGSGWFWGFNLSVFLRE